jgi:hypothetical protein
MSNNYVQVPPNSTGVKLQTFENTIGGNAVDAEAVSLVDTAGASILGTAGSANADVLTVQGITGATAIPITGANAAGTQVSLATPVLIAGGDGTDIRTLLTTSNGSPIVVGAGSAGTPSGGVITVQGVTSGTALNTQGLGTAGTSTGGVLSVQGVSGGTAVPVSGTISTITNPVTVVGDAANGAAVAGNPVLVAGSDGTDARTLATNTSGQAVVVGAGTAGSASGGVLTVQGSASGTAIPVANTPASGAIFEVSPTTAANTTTNPFFNAAGTLAESTAAWTSATTVNTALQVNTAGYTTIVVTLSQGTTLTGGVVTFEASDTTAFTNAYPVTAIQLGLTSATPTLTYTLTASSNVSFAIPTAAWAAVRVRLSTVISGTGTVNIGMTASAAQDGAIVQVIPLLVNTKVSSGTSATAIADNLANVDIFQSSTNQIFGLYVADSVYGGAFSGTANTALQGWSKERTPTVFKTVQATASGNTAVWTPGTGNKFRLLKLFVEVTDNASLASGGVLTINFQDATTSINISFDVFVPSTAVTTVIGDGLEQELDLGKFGILSAAANNALNVNLSSALATGNVRVIAMGTEE